MVQQRGLKPEQAKKLSPRCYRCISVTTLLAPHSLAESRNCPSLWNSHRMNTAQNAHTHTL